MAFRNAFCPNCGQPTQIDDMKEFCFCLSCGNKINVPRRERPAMELNADVSKHEPRQRAQSMIEEGQAKQDKNSDQISAPDDKKKEVEFYYNLSQEKKEYANLDGEPTYYLKGQDLLVDLSQQFPLDYLIWWELCKPMDFTVILTGGKSGNPGTINDTYFDKALDLAPLDKKMELIKQHDIYLETKELVLKQMQAEQSAREAKERARYEEQRRKEKAAEEERERQEKQRQQEEREKQEEARAEAKQKAAEFAQKKQAMSASIWMSLKEKDYSCIDNSYFRFKNPEGIPIIATLKVVANVLYLSAFHIDSNKNNTVYLDQSIAIHFSDDGVAIKFDNKPVTVRGWQPSNNLIRVMINPNGGCMVNDIVLNQDCEYVAGISKSAKKPLVSFRKVFS